MLWGSTSASTAGPTPTYDPARRQLFRVVEAPRDGQTTGCGCSRYATTPADDCTSYAKQTQKWWFLIDSVAQERPLQALLKGRPRTAPEPAYRYSMAELTNDVIAFLSEGTRTGKLGYVASDGRPLVAPIWFVVDGQDLVFNTAKDTAKARALARDPRVVLCVDEQRPPYSFVQVQGIASTSEDPDELFAVASRIGGRYMGVDRAEEFGRRNGVPGELVVRLTPTKVITVFGVTD